MSEESIPTSNPKREPSPGFLRLLLTVGLIWLIFGFMVTMGSLMFEHLSGNKLGDPFSVLLSPILWYLVPLVLIAYSLTKLETHFQVTWNGIIGITLFGVVLNLTGEVMNTHNYFVRTDENISQAFNNVEIMYQKRFNLIRNLDLSSKAYQDHERSVIQDIVVARKKFAGAATETEKLFSMGQLDSAIRNLIVNIELYPYLKADKVVLELMKEITTTERELLAQKMEFNKQVTDYNRSIRLMPYALTARFFNFQPRVFIDKESSSAIYDSQKLISPSK